MNFYKIENNELLSGPQVSFPDGSFIHIELKDQYTFPFNGWYYFETEEEAKSFFNLEVNK